MIRLNVVAALVVGLLAPVLLAGQAPQGQVRVHGTVTDVQTGRPLDGVSVVLSSEELPRDLDRMTNNRGRFGFEPVPVGIYEIRIVRIGYQTLDHTVRLTARTEVEISVELSAEAVELEPIIVETTRRSSLQVTGFYDRMNRGLGRFVTRDDIEDRNPFFITDVLRTMPGVQVAAANPGNRGIVTMRGGCRPEVFVDGARMIQPFAMDEFLGVHDVEALEVYSGAETPAQYSTSGCGTILIWTRRPGADDGRPFSWKRLFVGVGFLAAGFLLTR